jgi:Fe2+ transport system protein FeoA
MTLADLRRGDRARIESIDSRDKSVQRLMTMGLVEGAEVVYLNASLGGDPLELDVYGMSVSLRREQARCFGVSRMGAKPDVQRRG